MLSNSENGIMSYELFYLLKEETVEQLKGLTLGAKMFIINEITKLK